MYTLAGPEAHPKKLLQIVKKVFSAMDTNNDGMVTEEELKLIRIFLMLVYHNMSCYYYSSCVLCGKISYKLMLTLTEPWKI